MSFSVAKTLLKIAEAAFEFAELWQSDSLGRYISNGTLADFRRIHTRILELEEELEDGN